MNRFYSIVAAVTILLYLLCCPVDFIQAQNLHLNEIMASNNSTIADEDGDFEDWIEIYNSGEDSINLADFGLSDDYERPFRWVFPEITIQPGGFMLIWASNKDRSASGGQLHTNFAIAAAGEEIILTHPDGTRVDELPPTEIPTDISIGRQPDGVGEWIFFDEPTPGSANTPGGISEILEPPVFSHNAGFYSSEFDLTITHPDPDVEMYYTTDGSEPTRDSETVQGAIPINDRTSNPNSLSTIRTNFIESDSRMWMEPLPGQRKATIIKVKAEKTGAISSTATATYFQFPEGQDTYTLPVVSITTDSLNLFGFGRGIYVPGRSYQDGEDGTGNYYERGEWWERQAHLEFFNERGERDWNQDMGIRIHGGFTRRFPQKSLRLYARNIYGESRFNYKVFPDQPYDQYNRLILRNSGNDFAFTMMMDAAAQSLVRHFDVDTQAYRPTIVFLNGEYWGIKNLRERYDRHYLERVYGVDPDNVDLLTGRNEVKEGNENHYNQMIDFAVNNDLSTEENYQEMKTRMDIENFQDYYSAQIYFGNTDWPHNNIDFWRFRTSYDPDAPKGHDGRWRWLLFDVDRSLGFGTESSFDMIDWTTVRNSPWDGSEWPNRLFRNLLENQTFFNSLVNTISDHLNTAFTGNRASSVIDSLKAALDPEMEEHIARWQNHGSKWNWDNWIDRMHEYVRERPGYLRQHMRDHWPVGGEVDFIINVPTYPGGYVRINRTEILPTTPGVDSNPYPWTGTYFSEVPVTLFAESNPGYRFSHWVVDGEEYYNKEITLKPGIYSSAEAVFVQMNTDFIEPFSLADSTYMFAIWEDDEPAGVYPESMIFVYMDEPEPGLGASVAGVTFGAYNLDSRTRINGLGDDGFAFINTSNLEGNTGYPGRQLGGAVLVLDTRGVEGAEVGWQAGTVEPNSRIYNLRLQYRLGSEGEFRDVTDEAGNPVEYLRNEEEDHKEFIGPVRLPGDAIGQERVELLWRYYFTGERVDEDSGQRSKLNISYIHVAEVSEERIPSPHDLSSGDYHFTSWPEDSPKGSAPPSMGFVYMGEDEPGVNATVLGYTSGSFDLESRTRINGLGDDGFAFINTSNLEGNPGYPGRRLGGAVLALNTENRGSVTVDWTAGTVLPNSRIYNLRLQYRTSTDEPFRDVPDEQGNPVEYRRNVNEGHLLPVEPVVLPADAEDQPYVQLLWRYYFTGERVDDRSGQRAQLHISEINVTGFALMGSQTGMPEDFALFQNYPNPFYPNTTIRYDLPLPQHVRVDLYTITGRHVARLEDRQADAGRHRISVELPSLASGVYLYRITTELFNDTGKMSIIK